MKEAQEKAKEMEQLAKERKIREIEEATNKVRLSFTLFSSKKERRNVKPEGKIG